MHKIRTFFRLYFSIHFLYFYRQADYIVHPSAVLFAVYHAMSAIMEYYGCDVTAFYDHTLEPHFNEKLRSIVDQAVKAKRDVEYKVFYDPDRKEALHYLDNANYFYKQMKNHTKELKVS